MKKYIVWILCLLILVLCAARYLVCRTTAAFSFIEEEAVREVAYLTVNNGYQPLPADDKQRFIQLLRAIETRTRGSAAAADVTGEIINQFRVTLTNGACYSIGGLYSYLVIDGKGYLAVGQESEESLRALRDLFYDQADHMVPW